MQGPEGGVCLGWCVHLSWGSSRSFPVWLRGSKRRMPFVVICRDSHPNRVVTKSRHVETQQYDRPTAQCSPTILRRSDRQTLAVSSLEAAFCWAAASDGVTKRRVEARPAGVLAHPGGSPPTLRSGSTGLFSSATTAEVGRSSHSSLGC